ncbi:MAG: hypothetical protein KJ634_00595 [Gammaproteobacteria bacterium]|nr:hypothetical protein [Gammaproteobacteria bacterium]MBU1414098.1 hypothetical protein [Gammaproteobacteria bacterium]
MSAAVAESRSRELADAVAEACVRIPVAAGPAALGREIALIAPDLAFREVLVRGGWYRLGGVVDAARNHVAADIERWAAAELARHGDDFHAFADAHAESDLHATRITGKTHYWTASTGDSAADFMQAEIEELQEVVCHPLFGDDEIPASIEELIDPRQGRQDKPAPLGIPFYTLHRITDAAEFLARMRAQKPEPQPVHRFVEAWETSSAGNAARFSNHWVFAVREHLDRYRQPKLSATPVAAIVGAAPKFEGGFGARGLALAKALQSFDRQAGYPMAWFFHMLTTRAVPHAVAAVVVEDMQGGFAYLPERDVRVLKDWLFKPYGF